MSIRIIPDTVRALQFEASDPSTSTFVAANAGAGKTHVLTQRVIRLLLAGVAPAKILCITFTKAAAANMAQRVFNTLSHWITLDDAALDQALCDAGATKIGAAQRAIARRLFASALEAPGGLKVQTIHAFCTRLLQQFPFEANVPARFSVLDERAEAELLDRASLAVLVEAAAAPQATLGCALTTAIAATADTTFRQVITEAIRDRDAIIAWLAHAGGLGAASAQLATTLGIAPDDTIESANNAISDGPWLPSSTWRMAAAALAGGSANDRRQAIRLGAALTTEAGPRVDAYLKIFFNGGGEPRKTLITRLTADKHPQLARLFEEEQARLPTLLERRRAIKARDRTVALLTIAQGVIERYREEKHRRGLLDYDDLIEKTRAMLATVNPTWVHYKLDLGIDHVLIDEAQDTSPKQWEIIERLVSEFAVGASASSNARTVFAVGDEKQSIFSFQGAVPDQFNEMQRGFARSFRAAERTWRDVRLQHSFRSGANVLAAVDAVFADEEMFVSVTSDKTGRPRHEALPQTPPGVVEVWPLISAQDRREIEGWDAPFDQLAETSPQVLLAQRIASNIKVWTGQGTRAGDVLILVRQRGPLFETIIRTLKERGIPVAGADRLVLTEHIAVTDLMALADALLLADDDLALAVALKSPIFGLSEEELFDLAWDRFGSLRGALREKANDSLTFSSAAARLDRCTIKAREHTPFDFYAWLLGAEGARARFLERLGPEATDALDEFLELALDFERRETPSLQGFMAWLRGATIEIKRDMEITRDEVRVMTVHGAKGLEAPTVILADTTTRPTGPRAPRLLKVPAQRAAPGTPNRIIWAGAKDADASFMVEARQKALTAAENEYRRLLYVAMTRAANRLVICGVEGRNKRPDRCWYNLIFDALERNPGFVEEPADDGDGNVWRYRPTRPSESVATPVAEPAQTSIELPEWLRLRVPESVRPARAISPSTAVDEIYLRSDAPAVGNEHTNSRMRGTLIHRLLQSLPDVAPDRRAAMARQFLARQNVFSSVECDAILNQMLAILTKPRFAPLFAHGSRAEVPIIGRILRSAGETVQVSGQVDRLAVTADSVLIADYKTNRPAPRHVQEVPSAYVVQLALYRAVLAKLYPRHVVRALLLWTDVPDLMELSAEVLDAAMQRLVVP